MGRSVAVNNSNYWMTWLNEDAYDIDVFNAFITSTEFTNICTNYGITRGNSFDKFSMNYGDCFARNTNYYTAAPHITSTVSGGNFVRYLSFRMQGFSGIYSYKIYCNNALVASGGPKYCTFDSTVGNYVSTVNDYIKFAMMLTNNGIYKGIFFSLCYFSCTYCV